MIRDWPPSLIHTFQSTSFTSLVVLNQTKKHNDPQTFLLTNFFWILSLLLAQKASIYVFVACLLVSRQKLKII